MGFGSLQPAGKLPSVIQFSPLLNGNGLLTGLSEGLRPVVSTEAPPIIFATPTKLTSSPTGYDYAGKNKVPELQKFFQKSDGVPVHLKRGLPDQMLYRTTMALTVGGTIYCLIALYMASQPKNK
ncbi:cytochrome c oxidase subunit 7A2-like, mitochondrial isoform 1-T1 [Callospermophilus lateralis]|uniref:cytochrome c oxidase subunit 7A2-like, mitochondrial isoform X1 n=1 Tax=Callospermophilus lateralis TaxID=76772 RepID=UPI0040539E17